LKIFIMDHKLIYCVVKTPHVWCVIIYRQFHNYDVITFLYCHIFDSNYYLLMILRHFYLNLSFFNKPHFIGHISVSTFPFSLTDRIQTHTSENDGRFFLTISNCFHPCLGPDPFKKGCYIRWAKAELGCQFSDYFFAIFSSS
jgi:hypothetical protein